VVVPMMVIVVMIMLMSVGRGGRRSVGSTADKLLGRVLNHREYGFQRLTTGHG